MAIRSDQQSRGRQGGPEADIALFHLRIGWWSVAVFGLLGLVFETLHGFKVDAYLNVANETRRLMWTLAHAHGTLLGLAHLGMALTLRTLAIPAREARSASTSLTAATLLLPLGFFAGGIRFYAGDPGVGIAVVPVGALLLVYTAVVLARLAGKAP